MEYVKKLEEKDCNIKMVGKFTFSDHENFRTIIEDVKNGEYRSLTIDMGGINFVDSAALGMLLIIREEAEQKSVNLLLQNPSGQIEKMFKISKFDTLFNIV